MRIGTLVTFSYMHPIEQYGVIVQQQGCLWSVHWLTGDDIGDTEIFHESDLEVLCE